MSTVKSYLFDWDNNILHMSTKILLEKNVDGKWKKVKVSTAKFAKVRSDKKYRPYKNDWKKAFQEFTDHGSRGDIAFLIDVVNSIKENNLGPSYYDFVECLVEANFFGIITARGHKERVMVEAIKYLIYSKFSSSKLKKMLFNIREKHIPIELHSILTHDMLLDRYLRKCHYYCVSSDRFVDHIKQQLSVEEAKKMAVKMFISKVINMGENVSVGFSDDDPNNIKHVSDMVEKELKEIYPDVNFSIYDTSNNTKIKTS